MSFDLDDVLNLEQNFHQEGYSRGLNEDTTKEYIDGKQYGYQISLQRFLILGYYKSIIKQWLWVISKQELKTLKLQSTEKTLEQLLDQINSLKYENTESNGNIYDSLVKKLKLKIRLINGVMTKIDGDRLQGMNEILVQFGGVLEIENGDPGNDIDNGIW